MHEEERRTESTWRERGARKKGAEIGGDEVRRAPGREERSRGRTRHLQTETRGK